MVRIIQPTVEDWKKYRQIKLEALREEPEAFATGPSELENQSDEYWKLDLLRTNTGKGLIYVAEYDGEYIGMCSAFWGDKQKQRHQAMILWVYLRKDFRGRGISRKLMENLLQELKSRPNIIKAYLTVMEKQIPAINLYKSFGFKHVGTLSKSLKVGNEYLDEYTLEIFFN